MIKNDLQYRVTTAKLREFEEALKTLPHDEITAMQPLLRSALHASHESMINELRNELCEYEALKSGAVKRFECPRFDALPETLIKARIARQMSQKELAERCDLKEQQIQRYEATDYESASLWRLLEIATVLCIEVSAVVTLKKFERIARVEELAELEPQSA